MPEPPSLCAGVGADCPRLGDGGQVISMIMHNCGVFWLWKRTTTSDKRYCEAGSVDEILTLQTKIQSSVYVTHHCAARTYIYQRAESIQQAALDFQMERYCSPCHQHGVLKAFDRFSNSQSFCNKSTTASPFNSARTRSPDSSAMPNQTPNPPPHPDEHRAKQPSHCHQPHSPHTSLDPDNPPRRTMPTPTVLRPPIRALATRKPM